MRPVLEIVAVVLLLMPCPRVAAQEEPEPEFDRLIAAVKHDYLSLGVLLQAVTDLQLERTLQGSNGFSIANFRLLLYGRLDSGFAYWLQTNVAGSPAILDAMMSYRTGGVLTFDVGQFKTPFSFEFLTLASSIDFVNRAQVVTALAPGRQIGLQVRFDDVSRTFGARAGMFNGNGTKPNGNDNNNFLYAGRIFVTPHMGSADRSLIVGASGAYSKDDGSTFGGGFVTDFSGTRTHLGGDARLQVDRWLFSGELLYANLQPTVGAERNPWGFHTTVGYFLSPKTQTLVRFDGFQPDDGGERSDVVVVGFNAWPTFVTEFQVNYLIDVRDAAFDHHQLLANFQLGF